MEGLVTEAGKVLLTQGILGVLCVLAIAALVFKDRERKECDRLRFAELEKIILARESLSTALAANTLAIEASNKASDARTRATEEVAKEVADMRRMIELAIVTNNKDVEEIGNKVEDIRRALNQKGIT